MHSGSKEYALLLLTVIEVTDNELVAVVTRDRLTEDLPLQQMLSFGVYFYLLEEVLQPRIGIGVGVGDVNRVLVVCMGEKIHGNLTEKVSVW
jgi:hypothetical protein